MTRSYLKDSLRAPNSVIIRLNTLSADRCLLLGVSAQDLLNCGHGPSFACLQALWVLAMKSSVLLRLLRYDT